MLDGEIRQVLGDFGVRHGEHLPTRRSGVPSALTSKRAARMPTSRGTCRPEHRAQQGDPRTPGAVTEYLELADHLPIAERVLGLPAEAIANFDRIGLAESALAAPRPALGGGIEAYPDFETKAAVLYWHLMKNHPLPDGNKRCAFLVTVEFVERNGRTWLRHRATRTRPTRSSALSRAAR